MQKSKQETREEKISRHIRNLAKACEHEPILDCLLERKREKEAQLRNMSLEERRALVPWEETERERIQAIATINEFIADDEKELEAKREEIKQRTAKLRKWRSKYERQGPYC